MLPTPQSVYARVAYEHVVGACLALARTDLEYNCLRALVDPHATGVFHGLLPVEIEGGSPTAAASFAFEGADLVKDEFYEADVSYIPPYECVEQTTEKEVVRYALETCDFPPAALLRKHVVEHCFYDDVWTQELRTKHVAVRALADAWKKHQTTIRLALRDLQKAGIVQESNDYFGLSINILAQRMLYCRQAFYADIACHFLLKSSRAIAASM